MKNDDQTIPAALQIPLAKELAPVIRLNIGNWNPSRLQADLSSIISRYPFSELNQLNLTSRFEDRGDPYDGLGNLGARIENGINTSENDFRFFIPDFKDTVFYDVYKKLQEASPFPLGRVRLMKLQKKSCYTVHADGSLRFHLPIVTNNEVYFCFEHKGFHHLPAEGNLFCTNTLLRHTVVNGGNSERVHMVVSTSWNDCSMNQIKSFLSL